MFCGLSAYILMYVERRERQGSYHHLDMQTVVRADVECCFSGSYARPCGGIVSMSPGVRLAVDTLNGLVEDFQHADVSVIGVRVDDDCHPFEELVFAFVLLVNVEAWRGSALVQSRSLSAFVPLKCTTHLSSVRIIGNLSSRRTMQIDNDIKARIARPSTDLLQIVQPTLWKSLVARVY